MALNIAINWTNFQDSISSAIQPTKREKAFNKLKGEAQELVTLLATSNPPLTTALSLQEQLDALVEMLACVEQINEVLTSFKLNASQDVNAMDSAQQDALAKHLLNFFNLLVKVNGRPATPPTTRDEMLGWLTLNFAKFFGTVVKNRKRYDELKLAVETAELPSKKDGGKPLSEARDAVETAKAEITRNHANIETKSATLPWTILDNQNFYAWKIDQLFGAEQVALSNLQQEEVAEQAARPGWYISWVPVQYRPKWVANIFTNHEATLARKSSMQTAYTAATTARVEAQNRPLYGPYVTTVLENAQRMKAMRANNTDVTMERNWFGRTVRTQTKTSAYQSVQLEQSYLTGKTGKATTLINQAVTATQTNLSTTATRAAGFFGWLCFAPANVFTTLEHEVVNALMAPTTSTVAIPTVVPAAPSTPLSVTAAGFITPAASPSAATAALTIAAGTAPSTPPSATAAVFRTPSAGSPSLPVATAGPVVSQYSVSLIENPFQLKGLRPRLAQLLKIGDVAELNSWLVSVQKQISFKKAAGWKVDDHAKLLRESPTKKSSPTQFGWVSQLADIFSASNQATLEAQLRGDEPVDIEINVSGTQQSSKDLFEEQHGTVEDSLENVENIVTSQLYLLDAGRKPELARMLVGNLVMDIINVQLHGTTDERSQLDDLLLTLYAQLSDASLTDVIDADGSSVHAAPAPDVFSAGMKQVLSGLYAATPIAVASPAGSPRGTVRNLGPAFSKLAADGPEVGLQQLLGSAPPKPTPLPTSTVS